MWLKVLNLEQSLFPRMETVVGTLSPKEEKLMKVLDYAEIENFVCAVKITNPLKDREEKPKRKQARPKKGETVPARSISL